MDTKKLEAHRGAFKLPGGRTGISIREVRPLQWGWAMCFPQSALVFSNVQDLLTPFEFRLTFNISDGDRTRRDAFCSTCPVLDASTITTVTNKTVFQVACGPDNVCWADLILKASVVGHEGTRNLASAILCMVVTSVTRKNNKGTIVLHSTHVSTPPPPLSSFITPAQIETKSCISPSVISETLNASSLVPKTFKLARNAFSTIMLLSDLGANGSERPFRCFEDLNEPEWRLTWQLRPILVRVVQNGPFKKAMAPLFKDPVTLVVPVCDIMTRIINCQRQFRGCCGFFRRKAKEDLERSKRESLAASSVAHSPTTENPPSMPGDDPEVRTSLLAPEARE
ncbi:unnamed protein product [Ixodes pacificus]